MQPFHRTMMNIEAPASQKVKEKARISSNLGPSLLKVNNYRSIECHFGLNNRALKY
jgi:hypothetical protein